MDGSFFRCDEVRKEEDTIKDVRMIKNVGFFPKGMGSHENRHNN
jgi:hypothetical protein